MRQAARPPLPRLPKNLPHGAQVAVAAGEVLAGLGLLETDPERRSLYAVLDTRQIDNASQLARIFYPLL